jgi:hypothetical protein
MRNDADSPGLRGRARLALLLLAAGAAPALAVWSSDPANNLVIADGASEQVQAKVVPRADGGCYVSWFDNANGGYDVRLQRLSAAGEELWPHNGILVADRNYSSTVDYGLAVDGDGNALVAFNDDSQAIERIVVAKLDPNGSPLWGTPGIAVSDSSAFLASPKVAATGDGEVVVAWFQDPDTVLQRLDATGAEQWAHGGVALAHSGDIFVVADLHAADAANVVVSWVRYVTFLGDKHLWAQKVDSDAGPLWGAGHVQVFDLAGGSLQIGNFPGFLSDGSGGAVFAWYTSSPVLQVRAQRIVADGSEAFAHNGVELSSDASRLRVDPSVAFDAATSSLYAFWVEEDQFQNQRGLWGQRLDDTGARMWTASGRQLIPLGGTDISQVRTLLAPDGAMVAWAETLGFDDQPIRAARLDAAGAYVWNPAFVDLKTSPTGTLRMAAAASTDGFGIFAWSDTEAAWDIEAQNLNLDGTLGVPGLFADGFESGDTSAWTATVP